MTSQVRVLLGLTREYVPRTEGPGSFFVTWINILKNIPNTAVSSVVISVISIAIVWLTKWLSRRYSKKLKKLPIPGELFLVIGTMTIINYRVLYGRINYEVTLIVSPIKHLIASNEGFTIFMTFYKYANKIETVGEIPSNLPKPQVRVPDRPT